MELDVIITAIVTLITAIGGQKLLPMIASYFKDKNKYRREKNQTLEDYLQHSIEDLQNKLDEQAKHIEDLLQENAALRIEVAVLQEKLSQFTHKYGLGRSVGKNGQ